MLREVTEDVIAGRNSVAEALRSRRSINKLFMQEGAKGDSVGNILTAAKAAGIPVEFVPTAKLDQLTCGIRHQGVAALAAPVTFQTLDAVFDRASAKNEAPFLLLLDELQDPQNVGAIIRTAEAAGVHGILMPRRRSCPLNAAVAKTSAGAVEYIPIVQIGNIAQTMEELKDRGCWLAGADVDGALYTDADLTGPLVLVIGAEGRGLGRLVREKCDILVSIPMRGQIGSLNASNAAAVLMYESVRQRGMRISP